MANLLSRVMLGIRRIPHRILSEVDRASADVAMFGVPPPRRGSVDELEAERRREREVRRRSIEEDDPSR